MNQQQGDDDVAAAADAGALGASAREGAPEGAAAGVGPSEADGVEPREPAADHGAGPAGADGIERREPTAGNGADGGAASGAVRALRITVARSGGVAGVRPSWSVTASEEADVDSWLSLVESCPWDAPDPEAGEADRFVYAIRVIIEPAGREDARGGTEHDARVPERELEGPWGTLVERVKDAAKR